MSTLEPANNIREYEVSSRTKEYPFFLPSCFAIPAIPFRRQIPTCPPTGKKNKVENIAEGKLELKYYTINVI